MRKRLYRFTLIEPHKWNCGYTLYNLQLGEVRHFADKNGKVWLTIHHNGDFLISAGYSWDGCSPKLAKIGNFWIGVPDGRINPETGKHQAYFATLIHDILYQFKHKDHMPFSRREMDKFFYQLLKESNFRFTKLYFWAVRLLGGIWSKI